jgi:hypothetical protein
MSRSIIRCADFYSGDDSAFSFAPGAHRLMSLRPAIPWRVGLHQSPPPLYQPLSILNRLVGTVNHHLTRAGEFSTGVLRNFHPELTDFLRSRHGFMLALPVKRRRAMVATNPIKE